MKVDPRGFPTWWSRDSFPPVEMEVFRRKSWVIAMPIEAKDSEVRNQARKVLSTWTERS
jgi:hypothetical protein